MKVPRPSCREETIFLQIHLKIFFAFLVSNQMFSACAYRFSYLSDTGSGRGIRKIFVEAVFDKSQEVVFHEAIWRSIQEEIVMDGRFELVSASEADAIVQIDVERFSLAPTGSVRSFPKSQVDDQPFSPDRTTSPDQIPLFNRATEYAIEDTLKLGVKVRFIDLKTRKTLLQKTYVEQKTIDSIMASDASRQYLYYHETKVHALRQVSRTIAQRAVRDMSLGR